MSSLVSPIAIFLAGLLGGLANAFMSGTGAINLPGTSTTVKGETVWRPGWTANLMLGGIAALVSWALYGADAGKRIFDLLPNGTPAQPDVTWANLAAAVLIGVGGARWLSAEVEKNVFHQTAVEAANSDKNPVLAGVIASGSAEVALKAATAAPKDGDDPAGAH